MKKVNPHIVEVVWKSSLEVVVCVEAVYVMVSASVRNTPYYTNYFSTNHKIKGWNIVRVSYSIADSK